ncbi:MAG: flagellar motor protein MotD [Gallionellaceae bacterium]
MKNQNRHQEESNGERWLVSYADFITLLFAFFVVMYAISSVNEAKYKMFSESLKISLHSPSSSSVATESTNVVAPPPLHLNKVLVDKRVAVLGEQQRKVEDRMKKLTSRLNFAMAELVEQQKVNIKLEKRGLVMDISASSLFDAGKSVLHEDAHKILKSVAEILSKEDFAVEVEGHTDDSPIATPQFPSNWELSAVRASSVVRMLIDQGVGENRLSAVGLASNQPLVPNDSAENRNKNRRVTITILSPNLERG